MQRRALRCGFFLSVWFFAASAGASEAEGSTEPSDGGMQATTLNGQVRTLLAEDSATVVAEVEAILDRGVPPTTWLAMLHELDPAKASHRQLAERATSHRRSMVRSRAFEVLERAPDHSSFEILARTLDDPEGRVREVGYRMLTRAPDAEMRSVLVEHVKLGQYEAVPALVACADYDNIEQLLAETQAPSAVQTKLLGALLMHSSDAKTPEQVQMIVSALEAMGTAQSRDELWVFGHHWARKKPVEVAPRKDPLELRNKTPYEVEFVTEGDVLDEESLDRLVVVEEWSK